MKHNNFAPICLFAYKRLDTLQQTVSALQKNFLAKKSDLFIFSDAPKAKQDEQIVNKVRKYLQSIDGFKSITINESKENKGLANSIILGVGEIINKYGKVIVLEDDLISSPNFLNFMNDALDYYQENAEVFSIAGYTSPIKRPKDDMYCTMRASSWGWATWVNRWNNIDWQIKNYDTFINNSSQKKDFNKMGSDLTKMLKEQMTGKIDSWAIRWCYNQFLNKSFTIYPSISKIVNIGMGSGATHTSSKFNRFKTILDDTKRVDFEFNNQIELNQFYLKQFLKQFSISTRLKYKLLKTIFK